MYFNFQFVCLKYLGGGLFPAADVHIISINNEILIVQPGLSQMTRELRNG